MPYLAMTAAEMQHCNSLPNKIAWMSCRFAASNPGLDNLPKKLPAGSLIILDDSVPIADHDPVLIAEQLTHAVNGHQAAGVLLDFQRPNVKKQRLLANKLCALPCPIAVTPHYSQGHNCAVFLPPVPPNVPIEKHLQAANGAPVWLELALESRRILLTEQSCKILNNAQPHPHGFYDSNLCCHYQIQLKSNAAEFTLWRTKEDIAALLRKAESLRVRQAVGLWQELK